MLSNGDCKPSKTPPSDQPEWITHGSSMSATRQSPLAGARPHLMGGGICGIIYPPTGLSWPEVPNPTFVAKQTPHQSPAIHQKSEELSPG